MKYTAVYPGTFDPFTNGHLYIVKRALRIYDDVIISVSDHSKKNPLFSTEERVKMIKEVIEKEGLENVEVRTFNNLLSQHAEELGARVLIRGLRVTSDFEYEYKMAQFVEELNPNIEVVYLMATAKTLHISSSGVKEIAALGGAVCKYLPENVAFNLKKKFNQL